MTTYKEDYRKMALSYQTELLQLKRKIAEDKEKSRSIILDQDRELKYQQSVINHKNKELIDLEAMIQNSHDLTIMMKMVFFIVGLIIGIVVGCLL